MSGEASVTVVGAGVVGLACALTLQLEGRRVTVLDPEPPGEGTSYGNAGVFAVGSVVPLGTPGILKDVPGMLLDPLGPLRIRPSYAHRIAPWLWRLIRASAPAEVERLGRALAALCNPSLEAWTPLVEAAGAQSMVRRDGYLYVLETEAQARAAAPMLELRRRLGVAMEEVPVEQLRQHSPALKPGMAKAVRMTGGGHCLSPLGLSRALAARLRAGGGELRRARVQGFEVGPEGPRRALTDGGPVDVEQVVIAAGARSRPLVAALGHDAPLDTERGYHAMLPEPGVDPRTPMLFPALGIGTTPMAEGFRIAGTVEFGGLEAAPDWRRAEVLEAHARRLFPGVSTAGAQRWMGYRPSMPDSLPVLGRSPKHRNLYFAFGHGHLGLTLAAIGARVIADQVAGRTPSVDPSPYRIDRF
jgi:glycine/D-amino acid oxidase-like deaminating enzyme